jgi:hypothetical protein
VNHEGFNIRFEDYFSAGVADLSLKVRRVWSQSGGDSKDLLSETAGVKKVLGKRSLILALVILLCLALNLVIFVKAYPETFVIDSGCCADVPLAKDFSAYYTAAWRLYHDPSNVYTPGLVHDGGPQILPHPETYKYLPSFLIIVTPLLLLSYHDALITFDVIQFFLLALIAYIICYLLKGRSVVAVSIALVLSILQPFPYSHSFLSVSYYWQWAEGQNKVLNTALILTSYLFARRGNTATSGIFLALGAFDVRFLLLGLPLFFVYNKSSWKRAGLAFLFSFVLVNSMLFYPAVASGFLSMVQQSGLGTPLYPYALMPLVTLASLTILEWKRFQQVFRRGTSPKTVMNC